MIYELKFIEELARGVAVAVVAAASSAVYQQGIPTTREGIVALLVGLLPVAYAAARTAFTKATTKVAVAPVAGSS